MDSKYVAVLSVLRKVGGKVVRVRRFEGEDSLDEVHSWVDEVLSKERAKTHALEVRRTEGV